MTEVKRYVLQILVPMEAPQDTIDKTLEEAWLKQGIFGPKKMSRYQEAIVGPGMKRVTAWYEVDISEPPKKKKGKFEPELESK